MRFDVITLFPAMFDALTQQGITSRALERGLWALRCWNPRDFATDAYRTVDDRPYGGGPGMVMMAEPLVSALHAIGHDRGGAKRGPVLHLSPRGRPLTHARVVELSAEPAITLLASRYEAVDQRFIDRHVDEEISVGDFVVSGGELPAMMLMDAIVRLLPGALNDPRSALEESFATGLLDCPHYTRPEVFEELPVPPVLVSGHHARIALWRREQALAATMARRPELVERLRNAGGLDAADERFLAALAADAGSTDLR
ncbi:MAG TPA: tRNA (guanosine(37)-N1)-methyltransferase TrmD [Quisquiliibacterium sp.]|nr:tRNA (guanosine(37)-N1)-methyltransferase TrmD [Quisquiliibacterium sp.]